MRWFSSSVLLTVSCFVGQIAAHATSVSKTQSALAASQRAIAYDTGIGMRHDPVQALAWYRKAAELGDVGAMFNVAVCYDSGHGVARQPAEAAAWYRRAASHRFGRAEYNLALIESEGDGVARDPAAAHALFLAASRDGIAAARAHLTPETMQARNTIRNQPTTPAQNEDRLFATAERQLLQHTPAASASAAILLGRQSEHAGPTALTARYDLAWCYANGMGLALDRHRAYTLFLDVAARSDDPALRELSEAAALSVGRPSITASLVSP